SLASQFLRGSGENLHRLGNILSPTHRWYVDSAARVLVRASGRKGSRQDAKGAKEESRPSSLFPSFFSSFAFLASLRETFFHEPLTPHHPTAARRALLAADRGGAAGAGAVQEHQPGHAAGLRPAGRRRPEPAGRPPPTPRAEGPAPAGRGRLRRL